MQRLTLTFFAAIVLCVTASADAQVRTRWYRPYGFRYPGWGWGGGVDALGSRAMGQAEIIRSQGEWNRLTSEAMINVEEARSRWIDNKLKWTQTYLERQRIGKAARQEYYAEKREARDRWRATRESGAPPRLTTSQLDPSTGKIYWPLPLQRDEFAEQRQTLEELFVLRAHTTTSPELAEQIEREAGEMQSELKRHIHDFSANEYISGRKFLESLEYEARFPDAG